MSIATMVSGFNRRRKWKKFLTLVQPTVKTRVLDVGFNEHEYTPTENFLEKKYPWPENITALGIGNPCKFKDRYPKVTVVKYGGDFFPFKDETFDVCWSNAVLEHVGDEQAQVRFLREAKRVSKVTFVTTPNKHFPFEVHSRTFMLHFLPKGLFDKYLDMVGKSRYGGDYMNLLSLKSLRKILEQVPNSNYIIIKNKLLIFTIDFIVLIR